MKFSYIYRSGDGQRVTGEMAASKADEVFARLREQGIRPIKVTPVYGPIQLFLRKAPLALLPILLLVVVVLSVLLYAKKDAPIMAQTEKTPDGPAFASSQVIASTPVEVTLRPRQAKARARKQIEGLPESARELCALFGRVFAHPSEAWLARFAQPGLTIPGPKGEEVEDVLNEDLVDALEEPIIITPQDSREVAELKRIVTGLKEAFSLLLTSGKSIAEARKWLEGRQRMEADYRDTVLHRVADGEFTTQAADQLLQSMGFAPIRQSDIQSPIRH